MRVFSSTTGRHDAGMGWRQVVRINLATFSDLSGTWMIRDRKAKAAVETQCDILESIGHVIFAFTFT